MSSNQKIVEPGIKGWLLLPALALLVQPFAFVHNNLEVVLQARRIGGRLVFDYPVLAVDTFLLLFTVLLAYLFFQKRRLAPACYVSFVVSIFVVWTVHDTFASTFKAPIVAMIFICLVFIPYFVFSRRVKLTFTEPLDPTHWLDSTLSHVASALDIAYAQLGKTRKVWILELSVIAFMVIGMVLQSFVRAVFVLKDPSAFRQLLFG